jgi:hypothetical protein
MPSLERVIEKHLKASIQKRIISANFYPNLKGQFEQLIKKWLMCQQYKNILLV